MRYSTEPRFRKYVKEYDFLSLARKYYNKNRIIPAKTASKRVVQKTAEATGNLTGNKKADKITSMGKSKEKTNIAEEIYILPEKRQQIIDDLRWNFKKWNFKKFQIFSTQPLHNKDLQRLVTI